MKNYISICSDIYAKEAYRIDFGEWIELTRSPKYAQLKKEDSLLVFNGYNADQPKYPRLESALTTISTIFIDCDNPNADPQIIDKWRERMGGFEWMIYETASSTKEHPKFRAIVPLSQELKWNKYMKRAILSIFAEFADPKASWFFAPTLDKLDTIELNDGARMSGDDILQRAEKLKENDIVANSLFGLAQARALIYGHPEKSHDGWRHLPSVKKCLEGLMKGERDSSLNAACYAMKQNGYKDMIPQFLDEVVCDIAIKNKFRRQYR